MNQFDEFFEKKLNEEQPFSGQKRSWTRVNRDLHAFEIGAGIASRSLAIWKAVGIVAVLSSVALIWERHYLVQEINKLRSTPPPTEMPAAPSQPVTQEMAAVSPSKIPGSVDAAKTTAVAPNTSIAPSAVDRPVSPGKNRIRNTRLREKNSTDKNANTGVIAVQAQSDIKTGETSSYSDTFKLVQHTASQTPIPGTSSTDTSAWLAASENARVDTVVATAAAGLSPVQDSTNLNPVTNIPPPVIDPVRSRVKKWSAGIQLSAGVPVPRESGISAILGQGFRIQYRVWRNLSLNVSADFVKFDVNTDSISQHCSDIKIPPQGPGHHFFELKNVKSNRAMQQYNLGIGYTQKLTGRWSVTMQAAHTWAYLPSRLVSLKFEEMPPGGGGPGGPWHPDDEFVTVDTPKKWVSNLWRLGAGLQYDTLRWSFGIKGDYSRQMSRAKPGLEAVIASADVMYKF